MKPRTARSRRSLFVEVSRDAGEPTSRPLLFFSLPPSFPFSRSPSFTFVALLLPTCAFALPLILFVLSTGTEKAFKPVPLSLRPFRIISPFFSRNVLLLFSVSRSFLLLAFSSSCSHDSLYEVASSACNYCRYVLSASPFVNFSFFSYTLFYFIPF